MSRNAKNWLTIGLTVAGIVLATIISVEIHKSQFKEIETID